MANKQPLDLSFLKPQFEEIELPSRGKYYKGIPELESGVLHIRPMTSVEEKIIDRLNQNNFYKTIDEIISNCVQEDINVDDLTPGDRIFILLRIRVLSYGSMYEVRYTCPECGSEYPLMVDLSRFEPVYVDEDISEPYELYLPFCQAKVRMNVPRSGDIRESTDRSYAEQKREGIFISSAVYQKALCCEGFILPDNCSTPGAVVGQDSFKTLLGIMQRLHVKDAQVIDDFYRDHDHGFLDPIIMNCKVCNASFEQYVMLNWDFFRPRSNRTKSKELQQLDDYVPTKESNRAGRRRAARPSEVRELRVVGNTNADIHPEEKVSEENI